MPTGPLSLACAQPTGKCGFTAGRRPSRTVNASRSLKPKATTLRRTSYEPLHPSPIPSPKYRRYRILNYRRRVVPYLTPSSSHPSGGTTCWHESDLLEGTLLAPRSKSRGLKTQPRPPKEGLHSRRTYVA